MRILILGLDNSGKTTFLNKINGEDTKKIAPTFGFNIKTLEYKNWKLNCWDVGGQKSLRSYWRNYFERTDSVIWVVDSADGMRLEDCAKELHALVNEECLHGVTLLVMANKCDLDGSLKVEQISEMLRLNQINQHHWKIFETSAYTGHNLLEALDWLCRDVASRVLVPD
ncbi:ADP-ribosylation factor family domain-containing protein [Ditylenchus destructor]|nr:ADP-ribosylation factor family domain-containing protein [Ditylenchus destructor]